MGYTWDFLHGEGFSLLWERIQRKIGYGVRSKELLEGFQKLP